MSFLGLHKSQKQKLQFLVLYTKYLVKAKWFPKNLKPSGFLLMVEQNIIVVPLVVEWKTRKKQQRKMLSSADLSHAKDAIKHKNNPASTATPAGFLIRKHSTVLLCEEVRPGTSRPGLHFYCSMIPLRTQSDKKESPAALYDRAAGARWGICLSENNHRIRKHAC